MIYQHKVELQERIKNLEVERKKENSHFFRRECERENDWSQTLSFLKFVCYLRLVPLER